MSIHIAWGICLGHWKCYTSASGGNYTLYRLFECSDFARNEQTEAIWSEVSPCYFHNVVFSTPDLGSCYNCFRFWLHFLLLSHINGWSLLICNLFILFRYCPRSHFSLYGFFMIFVSHVSGEVSNSVSVILWVLHSFLRNAFCCSYNLCDSTPPLVIFINQPHKRIILISIDILSQADYWTALGGFNFSEISSSLLE